LSLIPIPLERHNTLLNNKQEGAHRCALFLRFFFSSLSKNFLGGNAKLNVVQKVVRSGMSQQM
jgi:hypothetical protein